VAAVQTGKEKRKKSVDSTKACGYIRGLDRNGRKVDSVGFRVDEKV
jgi:hypothetical protein